MSDAVAAAPAHPGTISPREVGTVRFTVAAALPRPGRPALPAPGEGFAWWPWGEVYGWIFGLGPIVRNGEIAAWEAAGLLRREETR